MLLGNPNYLGGWQKAGELPGTHWWPDIRFIATAADIWTYLIEEYIKPDKARNPTGKSSTDLVDEYLAGKFNELEYITTTDPNPEYDPSLPKDPEDPYYDEHEYNRKKTQPFMEYECSGLRLRGERPRVTLGVNPAIGINKTVDEYTGIANYGLDVSGMVVNPTGRYGYDSWGLGLQLAVGLSPSQGWVKYSGLEIIPGNGLRVNLLHDLAANGSTNFSGLMIHSGWSGISVCPANNSLVILPGDKYSNPPGGLSVKLSHAGGLCITEGGIALNTSNPDWPNGRGLEFSLHATSNLPMVAVKHHYKKQGKVKIDVPNPNYVDTGIGDMYDYGRDAINTFTKNPDGWDPHNIEKDEEGRKKLPKHIVDSWRKMACRFKGILPKDPEPGAPNTTDPFIEVEGIAYEQGCVTTAQDGLKLFINPTHASFLTLDTTFHAGWHINIFSERGKHCVLKARRFRDFLIVTAMNVFNAVIEVLERILAFFKVIVELPTIPDNLIKAVPIIFDGLEVVVDGGAIWGTNTFGD